MMSPIYLLPIVLISQRRSSSERDTPGHCHSRHCRFNKQNQGAPYYDEDNLFSSSSSSSEYSVPTTSLSSRRRSSGSGRHAFHDAPPYYTNYSDGYEGSSDLDGDSLLMHGSRVSRTPSLWNARTKQQDEYDEDDGANEFENTGKSQITLKTRCKTALSKMKVKFQNAIEALNHLKRAPRCEYCHIRGGHCTCLEEIEEEEEERRRYEETMLYLQEQQELEDEEGGGWPVSKLVEWQRSKIPCEYRK